MRGTNLTVIGHPAPQGSKSVVLRGGRPHLIEGSSTAGRVAWRAWRDAVCASARAALCCPDTDPFDGVPVEIVAVFLLPRPKSVSVAKRPYPIVKPDLDKLIRSTGDALADAGLVPHDQHIIRWDATKTYAATGALPGALLRIVEVPFHA